MPTHVSIATAIDKAKLGSGVTYISLLEIDTLDATTGAVTGTLRIAHNNEDYTYQGNVYRAIPFDFSVTRAKNELPQITLTIVDPTQIIHAVLQDSEGAVDYPVRLKIVSSANPDQAEIEEVFTIVETKTKADTYSIEFTLGAENPLTNRWPPRLMYRNRCFWRYRGNECGYNGSLPTCDYSKDGPNGCQVHNNIQNFGGFPGIRRRNYA